ncbi:MAG: hypothetical protein U0790_15360 [Isosphaeraceae bacterium]
MAALRQAEDYRQESEYHDREYDRYAKAAFKASFELWNRVTPEPIGRE